MIRGHRSITTFHHHFITSFITLRRHHGRKERPALLHVFPRQLPLVGGDAGHVEHGRLGRLRHQRGGQDRAAPQGRAGRRRRRVVRRLSQGRRRGARARQALRSRRGIRTRRRRSTCAHASTTRWASASARPRTRRRSRRIASRSNAFTASPRSTDAGIEVVEVPYEGGSMPGYFVHAQGAAGRRAPCVVHFDGLDVTKELLYMRGVPDLGEARHLRAGDGRSGHRRGDPLPRLLPAPRLRGRRLGVPRLPGAPRRCRSEAHRGRRQQPRRLLRAALRFHGAALRRVRRMGRDLGLLRDVEAARGRRVQRVDVGAGPPHHLDTRREARSRRRSRSWRRTASTASCRRCAARSSSRTAPTTSRCRSPTRRRSTTPSARRTRPSASSPPRRAARSIACATISRWASRRCGTGWRTSSSRVLRYSSSLPRRQECP